VAFAGGGTGGHVYPGIAVARALESELQERGERLEMLYIGVRGRVDETIVPREGIAFRAVSAGQLRVSSPVTFARNAAKLAWGAAQSLWILARFRPQAVFATGGYASVPVGLAARLLMRPLVVFLPDVSPGWAVRVLARLATRMTTTSERGRKRLSAKKTAVVGYPVRAGFWGRDRAAARAALGIAADAKLLLVTGASQGSRRINGAVLDALPRLLDRHEVLHLTGEGDAALALERRATLPAAQQARYHVRGYLDDMAAAMVAADLAVSRAGASTLGELPAAGLPAVLVPGEYEGWSQAPNAEFLRDEGAAVMLPEADLDGLAGVVLDLLSDEARLARMSAAMRGLARPQAARDIARALIEVAA
jgi:UDP-N-acetylglucosamine--N-acetylmuramyl-(pentapeptide) pyrophosphoryl-undecaprenol N-acetylglucosamine transferase